MYALKCFSFLKIENFSFYFSSQLSLFSKKTLYKERRKCYNVMQVWCFISTL